MTTLDLRGTRGLVDANLAKTLLKDVLDKEMPEIENFILSTRSYKLDASKVICDAIEHLPNLRNVNLSDIYSGIETEEAQSVLEAINIALSTKTLHELDFSDNALGPLGIKSCKPVLENMTSLKKLILCNDGLSADAIKYLYEIMSINEHPNLELLHFFNNMSGDEGAINVSKIIQKHPSIIDFRWASTRTGKKGGIELIKSLNSLNSIKSLDLNDNTLGEESGEELSEIIKKHKNTLIKLSLGDCGLENSIDKIIESLKQHTDSLEYLDLSYCEININRLFELCKIMKLCKKLKVVILSNNEFGNQGIKLLNHLFNSYCNDIEILNVNNNELFSYFIIELSTVLNNKSHFHLLSLDGNSIPDTMIEQLQELLSNKLGPIEDNIGDDEEEPIEDIDFTEVDEMIQQL